MDKEDKVVDFSEASTYSDISDDDYISDAGNNDTIFNQIRFIWSNSSMFVKATLSTLPGNFQLSHK